jgi:PhnB protein
MTKAIPDGYHALTPSLTFKSSSRAIEFYKKAFGAKLVGDTFPSLDGKGIMHAVMQIGDSLFMFGDEMNGPQSPKSAESMGGTPISMFLYVTDADAVFKQAVAAGAKVLYPVGEMFWGDRAGSITDPFGYNWMIATHTRDMTQEQITAAAKQFFAQMAKH